MRVTDSEVERWLIWGKNYGEIASFKKVSQSGRKWLIRLPEGVTITSSGMPPNFIERSLVPDEIVLTSREALAFGMGLAAGGSRPEPRSAFARREWGWDD